MPPRGRRPRLHNNNLNLNPKPTDAVCCSSCGYSSFNKNGNCIICLHLSYKKEIVECVSCSKKKCELICEWCGIGYHIHCAKECGYLTENYSKLDKEFQSEFCCKNCEQDEDEETKCGTCAGSFALADDPMGGLKLGQSVLYRLDSQLYATKVVDMDYSEEKVLIHFTKWSKNYDTWLSAEDDSLQESLACDCCNKWFHVACLPPFKNIGRSADHAYVCGKCYEEAISESNKVLEKQISTSSKKSKSKQMKSISLNSRNSGGCITLKTARKKRSHTMSSIDDSYSFTKPKLPEKQSLSKKLDIKIKSLKGVKECDKASSLEKAEENGFDHSKQEKQAKLGKRRRSASMGNVESNDQVEESLKKNTSMKMEETKTPKPPKAPSPRDSSPSSLLPKRKTSEEDNVKTRNSLSILLNSPRDVPPPPSTSVARRIWATVVEEHIEDSIVSDKKSIKKDKANRERIAHLQSEEKNASIISKTCAFDILRAVAAQSITSDQIRNSKQNKPSKTEKPEKLPSISKDFTKNLTDIRGEKSIFNVLNNSETIKEEILTSDIDVTLGDKDMKGTYPLPNNGEDIHFQVREEMYLKFCQMEEDGFITPEQAHNLRSLTHPTSGRFEDVKFIYVVNKHLSPIQLSKRLTELCFQ